MSSGEFSNYSLIQQHGRKVAAFKVNSSWIKRSRLLVSSITCIDNSSTCNLCPSSRLLAQRMGGCTQQKRTSRLEQHSQRQANLSCVSQQRHQKPLAMHHRSLLMTLLIHQRASQHELQFPHYSPLVLHTIYSSPSLAIPAYIFFIPRPIHYFPPQQSTCHRNTSSTHPQSFCRSVSCTPISIYISTCYQT